MTGSKKQSDEEATLLAVRADGFVRRKLHHLNIFAALLC
jgi:hypothetical protein